MKPRPRTLVDKAIERAAGLVHALVEWDAKRATGDLFVTSTPERRNTSIEPSDAHSPPSQITGVKGRRLK